MFSNSLDKKPTVTLANGDEIKDLTSSMFDLKFASYIKTSVFKVPKEFEMRIDLISLSVYSSTEYAELILKYNGISNPFSIKEGDVILIPALDSMRSIIKDNVKSTNVDKTNSIRNAYRYIDPIKIPTIDNSFKNRQLLPTTKEVLPPNISSENESQITYRNGRVYFGEGADTCLQNGITQSEFLTNVIKSRRNNV